MMSDVSVRIAESRQGANDTAGSIAAGVVAPAIKVAGWRDRTSVSADGAVAAEGSEGRIDPPRRRKAQVTGLKWAAAARNHSSFTSRVRDMAIRLHAVVASRALQTGISILASQLDFEQDPDEETVTPILRVMLDASPAQALAFWDSLDTDLDRWLQHLDPPGRTVLETVLGLRIHWR